MIFPEIIYQISSVGEKNRVLINLCNILRVTPDYLLMGTMHSHGVPQNLIDSLALCTAEDIALLEDIVHHMVIRQESDWNNDNFI